MADRPPPKMGPGRRVVYRPDHTATGFGGLLVSKQILDALEEPAKDVARLAAGLTPYDNSPKRSTKKGPHMRDSYEVNMTPEIVKVGKRKNPRVSVRVVNQVPHAAAVEFSDGGARPSSRPLGRAGGMVGQFKIVEVD